MDQFLLLLLMLALPGATAGPVDTCLVQSQFVNIAITPSTAGVNGAPDCPGCSQYQVCLTLNGMVDKATGISHTCVKSPSVCPPLGFDSYTSTWSPGSSGIASGSTSPAANGVPQCQYGQAGTAVYFLLKDGSSCQPTDGTADYAQRTFFAQSPSGSNVSVSAECRSRYGWTNSAQTTIASCTGNSDTKECVWRVVLPGPDCPPATPSRSPVTPSRSASPVSQSRSPSTSPSTTPSTSPSRSASPVSSSPSPSPSPVSASASPSPSSCVPITLPFDLWNINVVSFGDIGSATSRRGADYEGSAAAIGNVWYSAFSVNYKSRYTSSGIAHYVGGNLDFASGQIYKGGLEVAGNLQLQSAACEGNVTVGGQMTGGDGTVYGNVVTGGSCSWCRTRGTYTGQLRESVPFQPTLDLTKLRSCLTYISTQLGQRTNSSTVSATNDYGNLIINLVDGQRNFATLTSKQLNDAYGVSIRAPSSNAELIINVPDTTVVFDSLTWDYQNVLKGKVLLNMPFATSLAVSGGTHYVVMLAPLATLDFPSGLIVGNVVVGSILGGNGQVNDEFKNLLNLPCADCSGGGGASAASTSPISRASPSPSVSTSPGASPSPGASTSPGGSPSPGRSASPGASPSPGASTSPGASPSPGASASPGASPSPGASTSPGASPSPGASTSPGASLSPGASASPGASSSPGASPSPDRSASPGASPSPSRPASPERVRPNEEVCLECANTQPTQQCSAVQDKLAGKPSATIPNCDFNALIDALKPYRCDAVESCDTLVCRDTIPPGELQKAFQTCQPATTP